MISRAAKAKVFWPKVAVAHCASIRQTEDVHSWTHVKGSRLFFRRCAVLLAGMHSGYFVHAQSQPTSPDSPKQIVFALPVGFKGWACTDFGVPGAPPLPREGDALIVRLRPGEIVKTSDKPIDDSPGRDYFSGSAWWEDEGRRQALPEAFRRRGGSATQRPTLDGHVVDQECAFFGSKDEKDSAGEPPGFRDAIAVSAEERQALLALFESTDGMHWKDKTGWLGPVSTECSWYGVRCKGGVYGVTTIYKLDLNANNLVGAVPDAVARLENLDSFNVLGNHLSGMLPSAMIKRWAAQELDLGAEDSLLTNVSEIDFESSPSAVQCASHRITIRSDGSAVLYTERCRNATPRDRTTFCEVKKGHIYGFAKLAWLIDKNGFYDFKSHYERSITDSVFETTRVTRDSVRYEVSNYADAGPFELWVIERAVESVAAFTDWQDTTKTKVCPRLR